MTIELTPRDVVALGSDQDCTIDCECEHNCNCYPKPLPLAGKYRAKRGRRKGSPSSGGRPRGVSMPCGWGCGEQIYASTWLRHWGQCPAKPRPAVAITDLA